MEGEDGMVADVALVDFRLFVTIGAQVLIIVLLGIFAYTSNIKNKGVDAGTCVIEGRPGFKYTI
jgi:hypothetical protein